MGVRSRALQRNAKGNLTNVTLAPSFFLTEADTERLNIRGSRDPLGLVPLWASFGRKVVGNLTTASNSVRGFTTLILGFHFAGRIAPGGADREATRLAVFLKFEQLAGYARYIRNRDGNTRGITEIKRRIDEHGGRRIPIGAARDRQILSNQKTYGLWGLYTMPSIDSGLLVRQDMVLTPLAREFVASEYLPILRRFGLADGEPIEQLLEKERADLEPAGRHSKIFDALGQIMAKPSRRERTFYDEALVCGLARGPSNGWQPRFAELVEKHLPSKGGFDFDSLERIIAVASRTAADMPLKDHLERIKALEGVLVLMANLFGFLQDRDRAVVSDVVSDVRSCWSNGLRHISASAIEDMHHAIATVYQDPATGRRFVSLAEAVRTGDFRAAVDLVLDHNRFVMNARHKAQPWIQIVGKKIHVRYRDESQVELLGPRELARAWRNGFYLNPLKQVSDELRQSA